VSYIGELALPVKSVVDRNRENERTIGVDAIDEIRRAAVVSIAATVCGDYVTPLLNLTSFGIFLVLKTGGTWATEIAVSEACRVNVEQESRIAV
jgi:hypothetical protein